MPAEVIYGPDGVHTRISWGNQDQGVVQIVTQAVEGGQDLEPTERIIGVVNEWLKDAGMPEISYADLVGKLPYKPFFDGWWMQLDSWPQVNRLIGVLRKARDRSFGPPA